MKRTKPLDDDDDNDDDEASFESLSDEVIPHAAKQFKAAGTPLSDTTVVKIKPLHDHRRQVGILPDDGSTRREDSAAEEVAKIIRLYGRQWLDEAVARRILLSQDIHYKFARAVAGGSNLTLEALLEETEISRVTRARIADATKALLERRSKQQDSKGEQDRAKALRDDIAKMETDLLKLSDAWNNIVKAQACIQDKLDEIAKKNLLFDKVKPQWYAQRFNIATRSLVAKYTSGPRAFELGLTTFKTTVEQLTLDAINDNLGDDAIRKRLSDDMPNSSTLAFMWTTLLAIYLNNHLLDLVGQHAVFEQNSFYSKNGRQYAEDLRSLALIVFTRVSTNNLLLIDKLSIYMWKMLNLMIERSSPDAKNAPLLARPTLDADQRTKSRKSTVIVNDIEVTIDIADEDLSAAVSGQDVVGVDRDKLAELQRLLYNNIDQAKTPSLLIKLLEPMVNSVWKYLYYTKVPLDEGLDEEAFAGGYFGDGREVELWGNVKEQPNQTGQLTLGGFVVVARHLFVKCLDAGSIAIDKTTITDSFTNNAGAIQKKIETAFDGSFIVNQETKNAYTRNLLRRYVCRESLLLCLAEAIVNKNAFVYNVGITDAESAALKKYVEACRSSGGVPGSKRDASFAALEDVAFRVFQTSTPTTSREDLPEITLNIDPKLKFEPSQLKFIEAAMKLSQIKQLYDGQIRLNTKRIRSLKDQETIITQRIEDQLGKTAADEVQELENIIKNGFSSPADDALSTINTGYLFYTQTYWSALDKAYAELRMFVPCLARVYSREALVESENYQTEYAALVLAVLRLVDARNPKVYRPDKSEMRSKTQFASEAEKLRALARQDRAVKHWPGCGCGVVGNGYAASSASAMNAMSIYPLAPSLLVSRGAF